MNQLNLSNQDRVLRLIEAGITTPSRIAQRAQLTEQQVIDAISNLSADGRVNGRGDKLRSAYHCELARVWK